MTSMILVVEIVALFLVCVTVGTWGLRIRVRCIAAKRKGEGFDTLSTTFQSSAAPQEIVRAVYDWLQEWMSDTAVPFPARATDSLHTIYGLAEEDLEDGIVALLQRCGRRLPDEAELKQMQSVETVSQLVAFITACPIKVT